MLALYSEFSDDPGSYDYQRFELHPALCRSQCGSIVWRDEVVRRADIDAAPVLAQRSGAGTGADV